MRRRLSDATAILPGRDADDAAEQAMQMPLIDEAEIGGDIGDLPPRPQHLLGLPDTQLQLILMWWEAGRGAIGAQQVIGA